MSKDLKQYHDILTGLGITNSSLHDLCEKLIIINDDPDFIKWFFSNIDEHMEKLLVKTEKQNKVNGNTFNKVKEKIDAITEEQTKRNELQSEVSENPIAIPQPDPLEEEEISPNIVDENEISEEKQNYKKIYVKGEINAPGLYTVAEDETLGEIIIKAGGLTDNADESNIDFMKIVQNGETVTVPLKRLARVDLSGAVAKPGLYDVGENERLGDVIEKAGGLTEQADLSAINRAAYVSDTEKIIIPTLKLENNKADFISNEGELIEYETERTEAKKKNKLLQFFTHIKSSINEDIKHYPNTVSEMLLAVNDPEKVKIFEQGLDKGLSVKSLKKLLRNQNKTDIERLKALVDVFVKIDSQNIKNDRAG